MHVRRYVPTYLCVYVCLFDMYALLCVYVRKYGCTYVCMYVYMYAYLCVDVRLSEHTYVCMCLICTLTYVYVRAYVWFFYEREHGYSLLCWTFFVAKTLSAITYVSHYASVLRWITK